MSAASALSEEIDTNLDKQTTETVNKTETVLKWGSGTLMEHLDPIFSSSHPIIPCNRNIFILQLVLPQLFIHCSPINRII
ncbi:hypothetical protein A3Q56_07236 [Intoshia linei]|uniref:Uncharacterized protein n=1 Tax=Intoshia linei TaxID=1819745 RepID=A0A177ASP3_9BILA|nr:hypothetical protein A3Q56_07236 [Intoshia linei]